jgi:hypothetical protein
MKFPHIGLATILIICIGYALGRYFPAVGQKVGLP